jgi:hypothetical protein
MVVVVYEEPKKLPLPNAAIELIPIPFKASWTHEVHGWA